MSPNPLTPGLYIVATPIGNLGDLSPRAGAVLAGAGLILAEDTRVTGKLLRHLGVKRPMLAFHEHNEAVLEAAILPRLEGEAIALVSDAGTPLIADPGFRLVRSARAAGHSVFPVPGPCAAVAALSASGLPTDRFLFSGFLPSKPGARAAAIAEVASVPASLVFYETAPRLAASLAALAAGLGDRPATVLRELTKLHEESVSGSLASLAAQFAEGTVRGEIVIVVGPPLPPPLPDGDAIDSALRALDPRAPLKAATVEIADRLGVPKRKVYARALELRGGRNER